MIRPYSWNFLVQSSNLVERSWEVFIRFSKVCFIGRLGPSILFLDDIVLVDEARNEVNAKLKIWREL